MNKAPRVELQCEKISALKFFGVFDDSEEEISYDEEEEEMLYERWLFQTIFISLELTPFFQSFELLDRVAVDLSPD